MNNSSVIKSSLTCSKLPTMPNENIQAFYELAKKAEQNQQFNKAKTLIKIALKSLVSLINCTSDSQTKQQYVSLFNEMYARGEYLKQQFNQIILNQFNSDSYFKEILSNIYQPQNEINFSTISGLDKVKCSLKEAIMYPTLRPDIFNGIRSPHKAILLFGPPGNGKTMIAKAIAYESNCQLFSISASSLVNKMMGDSEKMMRALFQTAKLYEPSIIFIDEIDSILSKRSSNDHEASRRLKNEFLVQFDGTSNSDTDQVILLAATNRPQDLDDAALRRFSLKILIGQPEPQTIKNLVMNLLQNVDHDINETQLEELVILFNGYSCSDIKNVVKESCMEPLRDISSSTLMTMTVQEIRKVNINDFYKVLEYCLPSLDEQKLNEYLNWNNQQNNEGAN